MLAWARGGVRVSLHGGADRAVGGILGYAIRAGAERYIGGNVADFLEPLHYFHQSDIGLP